MGGGTRRARGRTTGGAARVAKVVAKERVVRWTTATSTATIAYSLVITPTIVLLEGGSARNHGGMQLCRLLPRSRTRQSEGRQRYAKVVKLDLFTEPRIRSMCMGFGERWLAQSAKSELENFVIFIGILYHTKYTVIHWNVF